VKAREIAAALEAAYPDDDRCFLDYKTPWELLAATILSAQCTDGRVNKTTPALFAAYPSVFDIAEARGEDVEKIIKPCGFYHTKARHIIGAARMLVSLNGGEVPEAVGELTRLPGVGRKTANVIRGNIFRVPSVVVDTHVSRVSRRLGLAAEKDPVKIERELMEVLPEESWIMFNHRVIAHGRAVCKAQKPLCGICPLGGLCEYNTYQRVRKGNVL
jgi:endonuclease-3